MSGDLERFRVIDAEPVDVEPPKPWPGFKVGVLVGMLLGIWITVLAQVFARSVS